MLCAIGDSIESVACLFHQFTLLQHWLNSVFAKYGQNNGYKLDLAEFHTWTDTWSARPGDERSFGNSWDGGQRFASFHLVFVNKPSRRLEIEGVMTPYFRIGLQRVLVDVNFPTLLYVIGLVRCL